MHKPIYHMIMGVLKNSIIIDKLNNLVGLYVLRYPFLRLNELVKGLKLLGHMVNCIINNFVYLDEFMVIAKACHLCIGICMFLETIFA
jgi:hypothetical protein